MMKMLATSKLKAYQFSPDVKLIGRRTRAQRQRAFNQIEAIRRKYEIPVRSNFRKIFTRQMNAILKEDSPDIDTVITAIESTDKMMMSTFYGMYQGIADDMYPMVVDSNTLKATWGKVERKTEDMYTVYMDRWIRENAGLKITNINDTTLREIQRIMAETESLLEFRDGIRHIFEFDVIPNRSSLIARTETVAGTNRASLETMKSLDSPFEEFKTWQTVLDADVRDSHMHMQGKTVGLKDKFGWAGEHGYAIMDHPADSTHGAPAGEVINCRCWMDFSAKYN